MWPTDDDGIIHSSQALDLGRSRAELTHAVRSGELTHLEFGLYVETKHLPTDRRPEVVYRMRVLAVARNKTFALSHESAAAVHGLEMLNPDYRRVHFSLESDGGDGSRPPATSTPDSTRKRSWRSTASR